MEESPLMNGKLYMECVEKEYSRIYKEYINKENRRNTMIITPIITDIFTKKMQMKNTV
jgi:hypothetical protein